MVESTAHIEQALKVLKECHQDHILAEWEKRTDVERQALAEQVLHLDKVTPGGLLDYVTRAQRFLEDSKNNVNPFDNYTPEIPNGIELNPGDALLDEMEDLGLQELQRLGVVLIAGGLGERLGYSGIKIDLPVITIEEDYCYLRFYAQYIHAARERALATLDSSVDKTSFFIPLAIMVSDDTHDRTLHLLEKNNYFGLERNHVDLVKQENVPALLDNAAKIALTDNAFKIVTKPHGHGDIHTLLYQSGVAKKWLD